LVTCGKLQIIDQVRNAKSVTFVQEGKLILDLQLISCELGRHSLKIERLIDDVEVVALLDVA
jgi:hypothetical protein